MQGRGVGILTVRCLNAIEHKLRSHLAHLHLHGHLLLVGQDSEVI